MVAIVSYILPTDSYATTQYSIFAKPNIVCVYVSVTLVGRVSSTQ